MICVFILTGAIILVIDLDFWTGQYPSYFVDMVYASWRYLLLAIASKGTYKKNPAEGTLHIRKCLLWRFRKFVMTVGYDEFVGK